MANAFAFFEILYRRVLFVGHICLLGHNFNIGRAAFVGRVRRLAHHRVCPLIVVGVRTGVKYIQLDCQSLRRLGSIAFARTFFFVAFGRRAQLLSPALAIF